VDQAVDRGLDEVQLARAIVRYLRDVAVLQVAPDAWSWSRRHRGARAARRRGDRDGSRRVQQMFERMLRCCDDLSKTLQPRLVLDFALIDVATIEPLVPLGDLIHRLGEMERGLVAHRAAPAVGGRRSPPKRLPPAPAPPPSGRGTRHRRRHRSVVAARRCRVPIVPDDPTGGVDGILSASIRREADVARRLRARPGLSWTADAIELGFPDEAHCSVRWRAIASTR
jgi:DNA polymerase-3 subunit gamma/tau